MAEYLVSVCDVLMELALGLERGALIAKLLYFSILFYTLVTFLDLLFLLTILDLLGLGLGTSQIVQMIDT